MASMFPALLRRELCRRLLHDARHLKWQALRADLALSALIVRLSLANLVGRRATCDRDTDIVVSLTTHGLRSDTVYLTLESIARGYTRPARLILWIDDDCLISHFPRSLGRLVRRGLEIKSSSSYGPHTKYYPYVASEDAATLMPLATADDDIVYPAHWLQELLLSMRANPGDVHCYRARVVTFESENRLAPYLSWNLCSSSSSTVLNFPTGVSGVLYPVSVLLALRSDGLQFRSCSPFNDDIWLHRTTIRTNATIRQVGASPVHFTLIPGTQSKALWSSEIGVQKNDDQIRATYGHEELEILRSATTEGPTHVS